MAATVTHREKSHQAHLQRDFSSPVLKPWGSQRLLDREAIAEKGESTGGERRSAPKAPAPTPAPARDGRRQVPVIGSPTITSEDDGGLEELREKLLAHLREAADRMKLVVPPIGPAASPTGEELGPSTAAGDTERPWNLRARRTPAAAIPPPERTYRLRSEVPKKKTQRFSVSLSRDEIEEDIFALTGSRPRRRPKKRPRNVQSQIDVGIRSPSLVSLMFFFSLLPLMTRELSFFPQAIFPGMWLSEISPELYDVPE
ncbi:hypothetical protein AXF42_Ash011818 [Apostasia shenzhenica]|uniref:Uncharacterized protein n=1 Tax=Apostasia shenzhenica TaxID=1088818 RepID=A0A2I0AVX0_9ASPA|nr:hypothetical protein AXF42_Ash011818 [Apostasia shenzhenica]